MEDFGIEVLGFYPEKDQKRQGKYLGRFDVKIKRLGILYSNVILVPPKKILLGGNVFKVDGKEKFGHFLRLEDPKKHKIFQAEIIAKCKKWLESHT